MESLNELLESELFVVTMTVLVYWGALSLQRATKIALLNPMVVSIAVLILFLKLAGISYDTYHDGAHIIAFLLKPAIVALGYPLYTS